MAMAADADVVPTKQLSVLLFNVSNGSEENVEGLDADQVKGIKAVLRSGPVQDAPNLFVLGSADQGQLIDRRVATLNTELENGPSECNGNVGIFKRTEPATNFRTTFPFQLGSNDRASFAKVEVPFEEGKVNILLVSCHAQREEEGEEEEDEGGEEEEDDDNDNDEEEDMVNTFNQLILQSDRMKRMKKCQAVIIGGDFKLSLTAAKTAVQTANLQLIALRYVLDDEHFRGSTHFVVYWPDKYLDVVSAHPKLLQWANEPFGNISPEYAHVVNPLMPRPAQRNCPDVEPFDHPRLLFKFNVRRPKKAKTALKSKSKPSKADTVLVSGMKGLGIK